MKAVYRIPQMSGRSPGDGEPPIDETGDLRVMMKRRPFPHHQPLPSPRIFYDKFDKKIFKESKPQVDQPWATSLGCVRIPEFLFCVCVSVQMPCALIVGSTVGCIISRSRADSSAENEGRRGVIVLFVGRERERCK